LPEEIATPGRFYAVVDSRGRVQWTQKVGEHEEHLLILVSEATPSSYLAFLRDEAIPYLVAGMDRVDLPHALELLRVRLGATTLVASGGGLLNGALPRAELVDEVDIDFLLAIIGGGEAPMLFDGTPLGPNRHPVRLTPIVVQQKPNGGIFVRYAVGYEVDGHARLGGPPPHGRSRGTRIRDYPPSAALRFSTALTHSCGSSLR